MSRSIHRTRRELEIEERFDYADSQQRHLRLERLREQLAHKRCIKEQVKKERREVDVVPLATSPESIPIRTLDEGEFIHYPATVDDIRNVMRLLPKGVVDGLGSIEFCLGAEDQEDPSDLPGGAPDPFTGRRGYAAWPGLFLGGLLGYYTPSQARIRVMAYVYDPAMPQREMWELYLRLRMLSTFIHEVAHHYDYTARIARGRWLADDKKKVEIYAERRQHEWIQQYVVPYLEQTYPQQLKAFDTWVHYHGGLSLSLSTLAGDPRSTENGLLAFFSVQSEFESLVKNVLQGKERIQTQLDFARGLHWAEAYTEALVIISSVLAEQSDHLEALTLQADIYEHQERYDEARAVAERVIQINENYVNAWKVLSDVYASQQDWNNLLIITARAMELYDLGSYAWVYMLGKRARARLHLGDAEGLEADLAALSQIGTFAAQRAIDRLNKEMALINAKS